MIYVEKYRGRVRYRPDGCDKLIRAGRELADRLGGSLVVMSALPKLDHVKSARVLEYLYSCSAGADAKMLVMYTDHPMDALIEGFKKQGVGHVLLGAPRDHSSQMGARLMYGYPKVKYYALDPAGKGAPGAGCSKACAVIVKIN